MKAQTEMNTDMTDNDAERREREVLMHTITRLSGRIMGSVLGFLTGALFFVATAWLVFKGGEEVGPHLMLLGQFWPGYEVSWLGAFLGFSYGFITGFVAGWFIGWLYSFFAQRRIRRSDTASG
ncbi:MAG: hypothetical protein HKN13_00435 [Rhodothermales bacterium]|nr:hypothetical protein [Rhodothermales bacterium]